jgi:hypothetical protein
LQSISDLPLRRLGELVGDYRQLDRGAITCIALHLDLNAELENGIGINGNGNECIRNGVRRLSAPAITFVLFLHAFELTGMDMKTLDTKSCI